MDKLRLAIVGLGRRTCHYEGCFFKEFKDSAVVSAVCDNNPQKLEYGRKLYADEFGVDVKAYSNYREMYQKEKLDGVFVAGPNNLHCDMTISAFEQGIDVMCEKPMEISLAKCNQMEEAAKKHNRILALGMQMHYSPWFNKAKEIIKSGEIGKISMLWCIEYRGPFSEEKDWVWEKAKSGGAIHEKNCHHYDILNMWADSKPTTVYASGNIMKHSCRSGKNSEIIDNAWIINDHQNGARTMVGICFLGNKHYREMGAIGTEGKLVISHQQAPGAIQLQHNDGREDILRYTDMSQRLRGGMFKDFIDCIRNRTSPLVTSEVGKESLLVPMAAEISIDEKRIVHVNEVCA